MIYIFSSTDDVQSIVSGKLALRHSGPEVEAMKKIAQASHKRSLDDFQKVASLIPFKQYLIKYPYIHSFTTNNLRGSISLIFSSASELQENLELRNVSLVIIHAFPNLQI